MTKLEAVNYIARRVLGAEVPALDTGGHSAAADIERFIDEQELAIQGRGWSFNTFPDIALSPSPNPGQIALPDSTIQVWVEPGQANSTDNITQEGDHLYDMDNLTDQFTSDVHVRIVKRLGFACIPEPFRQWIAASALCRYNESTRGNPAKQNVFDREELKRKVEAERLEERNRHSSALNTPDIRRLKGNRYRWGSTSYGASVWGNW